MPYHFLNDMFAQGEKPEQQKTPCADYQEVKKDILLLSHFVAST